MSVKIYATRIVKEDLGIELSDEQSALNTINLLQAQVSQDDIKYSFENVPVEMPEEETIEEETDGEETEEASDSEE